MVKCLSCGAEVFVCTLCDKAFLTEAEWAQHRLLDLKRKEQGLGFR